jgi:hypothetical protein
MSMGTKLREELYQGRALNDAAAVDKAKRIAKAVANVLDNTCESAVDAARGQGVSVEAVRAGVRKARES